MGVHSEAELDKKFIDFVKLLNLYLNHFPNHEKYGLSLEIRRAAYDVYGYIVEAQKRYHKKTTLTNLDIRHEQLRMYIRLAHELGYFEFRNSKKENNKSEAPRRYLNLSRGVDEIGRMIGGWISVNKENQRE